MLTTKDLKQIDNVVGKRVLASEKRLNKKIDKIDRKLDKAINFLDRDYIRLLERVERIENHLQLEPISS
jgi:hypothetical protein